MLVRAQNITKKTLFITACLVMGAAAPSHATQAHGGMEGIVVHQAGHLFFMISMGTFAYWLRERRATAQKGWRYIFYAALFFVLWNLDVMLVHLLEEQLMAVNVTKTGMLEYRITSGSRILTEIYFLAKHDHLLCVPPMIFFFLGLRQLLSDSAGEKSGDRI